jgi:hypothetical protein
MGDGRVENFGKSPSNKMQIKAIWQPGPGLMSVLPDAHRDLSLP